MTADPGTPKFVAGDRVRKSWFASSAGTVIEVRIIQLPSGEHYQYLAEFGTCRSWFLGSELIKDTAPDKLA